MRTPLGPILIAALLLLPLGACEGLSEGAGTYDPDSEMSAGGKADDPDAEGESTSGDPEGSGSSSGSFPETDGMPDDEGSGESGDTDDPDDGDTDDEQPPVDDAPAVYPSGQVHSPISPWVSERLNAIAASGVGSADVFMSVGDSITVGNGNLRCFGTAAVDLGAHGELEGTLEFFRGGMAAGTDPFSRDSQASMVGRSASWAVSGSPSPIDDEIAALDPALALVQFGTNDMQLGVTQDTAMPGFYNNMRRLLDTSISDGILPIVFTIPPRVDSQTVGSWVPTYNTIIRGLAQARQVPLVDLHLPLSEIDGHGLVGDGVHLDSFSGGACRLTEQGLDFGYNNRNLLALQALDRVRRALDGESIDAPAPGLGGAGTRADPFKVDSLPFVDVHDTSTDGVSEIDSYDCSGANEGGPELWYRVEITETTTIRALVLDGEGTDIDVHLLGVDAEGQCFERADRTIETTLSPGTYHFSLDTFVSGGQPASGRYLFAVVPL